MASITRTAVVLLALMALALQSASAAVGDCETAMLVPATSDCCCGPVLVAEESCDCSAEPDDNGSSSPATPAPAPVRTALDCQVQMVVAVLTSYGCPSDTRAATIGTRAHGQVPPRLAHGVFTL